MKKSGLAGLLFLLLGLLFAYGYQAGTTKVEKSNEISKDAEDIEHKQEEVITPTKNYIQIRRDEILQEIFREGMDSYEKVKAIHDYLVTTASYEQPIGLDAWILYGEENQIEPTYLEKRASSILLYGFGYCEDYAAAMAVLAQGAGIEVRYLAGLGYAQGRFMDHAWNQVKIDDTWYHVDVTFDDGWSQHGYINYDYFLKSDETMLATHRFGQALLDMRLLDEQQTTAIQTDFMGEACPYDREVLPISYTATRFDKEAFQQQLIVDRQSYEQVHGEIEPSRYDATPPVFGNAGFNRP